MFVSAFSEKTIFFSFVGLHSERCVNDSRLQYLGPGCDKYLVELADLLAWCIESILYSLLLGEWLGLDTCRKLLFGDPISLAVIITSSWFRYAFCHFILGSRNPKVLYHNDLKVLFKQASPLYLP